jgi:ribosomal protein L13
MHAGSPAARRPDARDAALGRVAAGIVAAPLRRRPRADRGELALVERAARRMVLGRRVR